MKLKLCSYADVSTGHITKDDALRLAEDARATDERRPLRVGQIDATPRLIVFAYDAGFFVHTAVAADEDEMAALAPRFSPSLLDLVKAAYQQGAVFLRLDRDGTVDQDIPSHDW